MLEAAVCFQVARGLLGARATGPGCPRQSSNAGGVDAVGGAAHLAPPCLDQRGLHRADSALQQIAQLVLAVGGRPSERQRLPCGHFARHAVRPAPGHSATRRNTTHDSPDDERLPPAGTAASAATGPSSVGGGFVSSHGLGFRMLRFIWRLHSRRATRLSLRRRPRPRPASPPRRCWGPPRPRSIAVVGTLDQLSDLHRGRLCSSSTHRQQSRCRAASSPSVLVQCRLAWPATVRPCDLLAFAPRIFGFFHRTNDGHQSGTHPHDRATHLPSCTSAKRSGTAPT